MLITFDDKELQAALSQSRAAAEKSTHGFRSEEIAEARAAAAQARAEYEQRKNGYRQEDIDAAKADLDRATADEVRAIWIISAMTRWRKKIWFPSNSEIPRKRTGKCRWRKNRARSTGSTN